MQRFSTLSVVCMSKLSSGNIQITTVFTKIQQVHVRSVHVRLYPDTQQRSEDTLCVAAEHGYTASYTVSMTTKKLPHQVHDLA